MESWEDLVGRSVNMGIMKLVIEGLWVILAGLAKSSRRPSTL